jgi:hypothetical protein
MIIFTQFCRARDEDRNSAAAFEILDVDEDGGVLDEGLLLPLLGCHGIPDEGSRAYRLYARARVVQNAPTKNKVFYEKSCGETKRKKERLK